MIEGLVPVAVFIDPSTTVLLALTQRAETRLFRLWLYPAGFGWPVEDNSGLSLDHKLLAPDLEDD